MDNIEQYAYPNLKPLEQDWRWGHKYAHDVVTGAIPSGKLIKQACERHFFDLQRDDIYFDVESAKSIVSWFRFIPITDGFKAGSPTILLPWQIWVVVSLIAWKWNKDTFDEDGNPLTVKGQRRYNQAFILLARKGGKTTIAAGIELYLMYKSGYQPRAYSLATKRDQAKILWKAAKVMIKLSPRLKTIFEVRANEILMPSKDGEFKALASDSNSLDGLNPVTASLDECHAIKDRNLYGVIISAFGAQTEYLMLTITTAGFVLDGICTDLHKNGARVLDPDDDITQDNYFYAMWQIDKGDDWADPKSWYKSNAGLIYGLPRMQYLRDRFQEAQMSVEEKGNFLTKHCNLFVSGADKWLDLDQVKECSAKLNYDEWKEYTCYVGLDRALVSDITSASILFPSSDGGVAVFFRNLQSQGAIKNANDYLRGIYLKADASADLGVMLGESIRDEHVKTMIRELWSELPKCKGFYYDPYHMKQIALDLEEEGIPMISVSQGTGNMSEPAKKIESLISDGLFTYNNSVLFEYACSCALTSVTRQGNMQVYRDPNNSKVDKIDPLIATIIALSGATLIKQDESIYNERGMISI